MRRTRALRVAIACGLVGVVGWTVAPYTTNYVSTSAVVNAPLAIVKSPIDGVLARPSARPGTALPPGDPMVAIEAARHDRRHLRELTARLGVLDERIAAVSAEVETLRSLGAELELRLDRHRERALQRIAAERRENEAARRAARARLARAEDAWARGRKLLERGHLTRADQIARETDRRRGQARVAELTARLQALAVEARAVREGTFVRDGFNDVPYSQQRHDEIELRIAALQGDLRRLRGERDGLGERIAAERARLAEVERFHPRAGAASVVWKASGPAGEPLSAGQEVLQVIDCRHRFVEVAVSERHFDDIRPGELADVRLKGGGGTLEAPIVAVRGAGGRAEHPSYAATVPNVEAGQLRVLVSLEGVGLPRDAAAFCHVGRTAEVRFPRRALDLLERAGARIGEIVARLDGGGAAAAGANGGGFDGPTRHGGGGE